ncbi:MAG: Chorismate mutase [Hyphomicrobiales bacterium]|nr:Chorismate mutase [Hyphomicrobiales bacterium]
MVAVHDADKDPQQILGELRVEIDRIDAEMHALLMSRGEIVDRLIGVKARQGGGSAFRPGREAEMMRRLAERHRGLLPLDTIEGIWRIIISTFTFVQSNYSVHADIAGGEAAMRDSERFHFGFTVPYITHHGAAGVIDAVARSSGDLGMFRIDGGITAGAWWKRLIAPEAPKIIARLPFVERPDHPAGMPVFVVAKPLADAAARDIILYCAQLERWRDALPSTLVGVGAEIIGNAADEYGLSLLLAAPAATSENALQLAMKDANAGHVRLSEVGSHAARFAFQRTAHPLKDA